MKRKINIGVIGRGNKRVINVLKNNLKYNLFLEENQITENLTKI